MAKPPDRSPHFDKETARGWIKHDIELARDNKNPLYIWEAILKCFIFEVDIDPVCMEYIKETALNMKDLIDKAREELSEKRRKSRAPEKPQITAANFLKRVPIALQMSAGVKGEANAFARLARDEFLRNELSSSMTADAFKNWGIESPLKPRAYSERNERRNRQKALRLVNPTERPATRKR